MSLIDKEYTRHPPFLWDPQDAGFPGEKGISCKSEASAEIDAADGSGIDSPTETDDYSGKRSQDISVSSERIGGKSFKSGLVQ